MFVCFWFRPKDGSKKQVEAVNAREMAPGGATEDMFTNGTSSSVGKLLVYTNVNQYRSFQMFYTSKPLTGFCSTLHSTFHTTSPIVFTFLSSIE